MVETNVAMGIPRLSPVSLLATKAAWLAMSLGPTSTRKGTPRLT